MRSKYGVKDVAAHRREYDRRYYKANREKILKQHNAHYRLYRKSILHRRNWGATSVAIEASLSEIGA